MNSSILYKKILNAYFRVNANFYIYIEKIGQSVSIKKYLSFSYTYSGIKNVF